jgi:hypothetical protein
LGITFFLIFEQNAKEIYRYAPFQEHKLNAEPNLLFSFLAERIHFKMQMQDTFGKKVFRKGKVYYENQKVVADFWESLHISDWEFLEKVYFLYDNFHSIKSKLPAFYFGFEIPDYSDKMKIIVEKKDKSSPDLEDLDIKQFKKFCQSVLKAISMDWKVNKVKSLEDGWVQTRQKKVVKAQLLNNGELCVEQMIFFNKSKSNGFIQKFPLFE